MIHHDTIENYIPQRKPMVMIDALVEVSSTRATSSFVIKPGNIFVKNNVLSAEGLIENIAQTAAAQNGSWFNQQQLPVPLGFIAALKDVTVFALPKVHTTLATHIEIVNQVFDVTIVKGTCYEGSTLLLELEMKIFITK